MDIFEFTRLVEALEVVTACGREASDTAVAEHAKTAVRELRSAVRQGVEALLENI